MTSPSHEDKERADVCVYHCPFEDECHQSNRLCPFHPEHEEEEEKPTKP
jgi:hypothetical protein